MLVVIKNKTPTTEVLYLDKTLTPVSGSKDYYIMIKRLFWSTMGHLFVSGIIDDDGAKNFVWSADIVILIMSKPNVCGGAGVNK
jgi:hypothetical protein